MFHVKSTPKYFAMIAHMADDELNLYEYRLYGHYKRVCGEKNRPCYETERTTAKAVGFCREKVAQARTSLVQKGYIVIRQPGVPAAPGFRGSPTVLYCADLWATNIERFTSDKAEWESGSPAAPAGLVDDRSGRSDDPGGSPDDHKKKEKSEKEKDSDISPQGALPQLEIDFVENTDPEPSASTLTHPLKRLILDLSRSKELTPRQEEELNAPLEWYNAATHQTEQVAESCFELWDQEEAYREWLTEIAIPRKQAYTGQRIARTQLISTARNVNWYKGVQYGNSKAQTAPAQSIASIHTFMGVELDRAPIDSSPKGIARAYMLASETTAERLTRQNIERQARIAQLAALDENTATHQE